MFIYLPVCAILTVLIVYIDVTGYSMYTFLLLYYILCISNISPQSVVNFRFTICNATRHSKFHILCGTLWLLHIYIFYTKYWLFL